MPARIPKWTHPTYGPLAIERALKGAKRMTARCKQGDKKTRLCEIPESATAKCQELVHRVADQACKDNLSKARILEIKKNLIDAARAQIDAD